MKRNYSKFISVTLVLVVVMNVFAFPAPVYAGSKPGVGDQTAYAVFKNNAGDVGDQIGLADSSSVTVFQDQNVFVCIQQYFTQQLEKEGMGGRWRLWEGEWDPIWDPIIEGSSSSTNWEYWDSRATALPRTHF